MLIRFYLSVKLAEEKENERPKETAPPQNEGAPAANTEMNRKSQDEE